MRVVIEVDEALEEESVTIRCKQLDDRVVKLQHLLKGQLSEDRTLFLHKDDKEFYVPLNQILFFETENKIIRAHTKNEMYVSEYKLYELEELLPGNFLRVSKSTIGNLDHIYSITKNITSSSEVEFLGSHKRIYVSRNYYKLLVDKLAEKRRKL